MRVNVGLCSIDLRKIAGKMFPGLSSAINAAIVVSSDISTGTSHWLEVVNLSGDVR